METSIYRYIIRYSLRRQVVLTIMATASFPFLYAFYELPKLIVNSAIQGKNTTFPTNVSQIQFDQVEYLWLLCGVFLALVIVNQAFKYIINVYAGITGERMLRRLRFDLYGRVLRFPLPQFRKTSSSEIVTMVTAEVEPLGGFIGDAFKLPIFQGGYLIVILAFLFVQNWYMALAAVALYPLQGYLIPKLQRRVNRLGKERVRLVRQLSDRIGESVAGVQEIHTHNTARRERADCSHRLGAIYEVRLQIYIWKFIVKFLNNTINQLGPFSFYAIGGYLAIKGDLEIGTLMAAIAAHKDLAAPWKELLNFYQRQADARIKYEQVMEQFQPVGMAEESRQLDEPDTVNPLSGEISATNLSLVDDTGAALVEGASFVINATEHIALVGGGGSGKDETTQMLARLLSPTSGTLRLGGEAAEALAAGNSTDDLNADWVDYDATGTPDENALLSRIFDTLKMVTLDGDIYHLGLRGSIDPATQPGLAEQFLKARAEFHTRLTDPQIAALVEGFDPDAYNKNATLGENLLFGTPIGAGFDMDRLAENPYVINLLEREGLIDVLLDAGQQIASTMTELFADLPAGHPFFEQFSFISAEDLPEYQAVLTRINRDGIASLRPEERTMLLSLPFKVSPARHRLGVINGDLQQRILKARKAFADNLPNEYRGMVEFFDVGAYNAAASLQDNILFGKLAYGQARGGERVGEIIAQVIDDLGLRAAVMEVGLSFHVGNGGGRLSGAQRQKLGIARAILKRPDVLILNEATGGLDGAAQNAILAGLKREFDGRGLIWAVHRPSMAAEFDRAVVMKSGRVIEQGPFEELNREGTALHELMKAE